MTEIVDIDQTYESVKVDHPLHGMVDVEVPVGMSDSEVLTELDNMDLDLVLGLGNLDEDKGVTSVEKIKAFENSVNAGLREGKWFPHNSLEGGTQTIAYGHKLTADEAESGFIDIKGELVDYRLGLTQEQAEAVLKSDTLWAETHAIASLKKVGLDTDESKVEALTSLIYNVGSGAWGGSKAKKYLEAGHIEDFMHEAFSEEAGFVNINGEKSRGLARRRAAEASLFASANIDEGSGFGDMMAEVLSTINPISSAAAAEITPQQAEQQMALQQANETLGKLSGVGPAPRKPEIEKAASKFNITPAAFTSFGESLVRGAMEKWLGIDVDNVQNTALNLQEGDIDALRKMYMHIEAQGRTSFNKEDWANLIGEDLASTDGKGTGLMGKIMTIMQDPVANMAMTIGAGEIKEDENGVYIEDVYDFNEGKKGKKYEDIVKKKGFFGGVFDLFQDSELDGYTKLRVLGYLLQPEGDKKSKIYLEGTRLDRLKSTLSSIKDEE